MISLLSKVFDKQYFVELSDNAWQMRNIGGPEDGGPPQDWTTGTSGDRMMLNTDVCLMYDIDENVDSGTNCCTNPDGENPCIDQAASRRRCPRFKEDDPRRAGRAAVKEYSGGDDNSRFYSAFAEAWRKATTIGQRNLAPLEPNCDIEYW